MSGKTDYTNCQVLDSDGNRCKRKAVKTIRYHGDCEIYSYNFAEPKKDKTWVEVGVCKIHAS